jgi:hypothetical protein
MLQVASDSEIVSFLNTKECFVMKSALRVPVINDVAYTRIDKHFEGTTDAGKAWFANKSKGSEAGLSMGEVRLRP